MRNHRKILSTIFFVFGVLDLFGWIGMGGWQSGEWLYLFYTVFFIVTGLKIHNNTTGANLFGTVASIIYLFSFPIGSIIGIYGLWYFLFNREE